VVRACELARGVARRAVEAFAAAGFLAAFARALVPVGEVVVGILE
jgi:hypothetical protein